MYLNLLWYRRIIGIFKKPDRSLRREINNLSLRIQVLNLTKLIPEPDRNTLNNFDKTEKKDLIYLILKRPYMREELLNKWDIYLKKLEEKYLHQSNCGELVKNIQTATQN